MTAAIFVFAGVVSVAAARDAAKTTVTIHYNGDGFQGKLKGSEGQVHPQPTVKVIKKSNARSSTRTPRIADGRWNTGNSADPRHVLCPHPQVPGAGAARASRSTREQDRIDMTGRGQP